MSEQAQTRNIIVGIDIQNDFIDGSLAVPDGAMVIPPLNKLATAARENEQNSVILTRDWHPSHTPHFTKWPSHCVQDTRGAEFHPDLSSNSTDIILSKGMGQTDGYSGMEAVSDDGRTLEQIVTPTSKDEIVRVFMGGLATDYCVKATALDLAHYFRDDPRVELFLIRDAVRAVKLKQEDEESALKAMFDAKVAAISSDEILARFLALEV